MVNEIGPVMDRAQVSKIKREIADSWETVRPVCVFLTAITVVSWAMAIKGLDFTSLELGLIIFGISTLVVIRVRAAITAVTHRSALLRKVAAEAEGHHIHVLIRVVEYVEARDKYWSGHSRNVGELCEKMARKLKMSKEQCRLMKLAGRLHDIGVLAVPPSARMSHSRLAVNEFRSVQKHPEASYEVLKPLESVAPVLEGIRYHHERMNGTGYPKGLSGEKIPLAARIIAVADSYDAMTHDRPHRPAVTPLQAMRELRRCTPSGYDRKCVDALAEVLSIGELEKTLVANRQASAETTGVQAAANSA